MSAGDEKPAGFTLRRWSQRKLAAARESPAAPAAAAVPAPPFAVAAAQSDVPAAQLDVPSRSAAVPSSAGHAATPASDALPPIDSLGVDSDFSVFMQPKVEESLKRQALKRLFQDPHFNVMDGLDTYIDDYSIPDPIPPEMLAQLTHTRYLFDPPKTRVNAEGYVEDVPPEDANAAAQSTADDPPAALADGATPDATAASGNIAAAASDAAAESTDAAIAIQPAQPDAEPAPSARPDDQGTPAR